MKNYLTSILYLILVLIFIVQVQALGWFLGDNNVKIENLQKVSYLGIDFGYESFKFIGIFGVVLFLLTLLMIGFNLIKVIKNGKN